MQEKVQCDQKHARTHRIYSLPGQLHCWHLLCSKTFRTILKRKKFKFSVSSKLCASAWEFCHQVCRKWQCGLQVLILPARCVLFTKNPDVHDVFQPGVHGVKTCRDRLRINSSGPFTAEFTCRIPFPSLYSCSCCSHVNPPGLWIH